jgi:hypothetical protein
MTMESCSTKSHIDCSERKPEDAIVKEALLINPKNYSKCSVLGNRKVVVVRRLCSVLSSGPVVVDLPW